MNFYDFKKLHIIFNVLKIKAFIFATNILWSEIKCILVFHTLNCNLQDCENKIKICNIRFDDKKFCYFNLKTFIVWKFGIFSNKLCFAWEFWLQTNRNGFNPETDLKNFWSILGNSLSIPCEIIFKKSNFTIYYWTLKLKRVHEIIVQLFSFPFFWCIGVSKN